MYLNVRVSSPAPQTIPKGYDGYFDWSVISDEEKARRGWPRHEPPQFDPLYQHAVPSFEQDEDGLWRVSYTIDFVDDHEPVLSVLIDRLATRRWTEMVKPVTVEIAGEPVRIGYDRDSDSLQKKLSVAQVIEAQADEAGEPKRYSFTFSAIDGPVTMTKADIIAAGLALETHVQACFDREAAIRADLQSRRTTHTLIEAWNDQIDEGWPPA